MAKKQWVLLVILPVLACVYVYYFTDWFKPKIIQISYTERSSPSRVPSQSSLPTILFGFGGQRYQLSEVKVVPLATWQTNQSTAAVWHLISSSRSAPVELFRYGQNLRGMKSAVPGARPEPLESNVIYRIFVRAGSLQGQCDFRLGGRPPATPSK